MASEQLPQVSLDIALRRLDLCTYAIQEIHMELEAPQDPDSKADLILAAEKLLGEIIELYQTVKLYVWGVDEDNDEE